MGLGLMGGQGVLLNFGFGSSSTVCLMSEISVLSSSWDVMAVEARRDSEILRLFEPLWVMLVVHLNTNYRWPLWWLAIFLKPDTCLPLAWNVAPFSKVILRKCSTQPRKSINGTRLASQLGSEEKKASLCWARGRANPQVPLRTGGK